MKRIYLTLLNVILLLNIAQSQSASDALRYSSVGFGGTARSMGTGNSMGAFGGDFSTLGINPAGLATYRKSEFTLSLGYFNANTKSKLNLGTSPESDESANKFAFNNLGLVLSSQPDNGSKWKTSNFAIGLNKTAEFDRTIYYQGNIPGSIVSRFANLANNGQLDDFGSRLAYETYALDTARNAQGKLYYYTDFDAPGAGQVPLNRTQSIQSKGRVSELVISFAGNYDDKLQLGATIGVPFAKYEVVNSYGEADNTNGIKFFNNLNFTERYTADGTGINLKIGAIYRPIQMLRVGLAIHTPTAYTFAETRNTEMTYNYTDSKATYNENAKSPEGVVDYKVNTPWKVILSTGVLLGKNGFLTAEAEYLDYSSARVRFDTPDSIGAKRIQELKQYESEITNDVTARYKSALNLRFGGEAVLDIFRLRAGLNLLGSALQGESGFRAVYSLGFGIRGENTFFDVAFQTQKQSFTYQPFVSDLPQPSVSVNSWSNNFNATFGFRF